MRQEKLSDEYNNNANDNIDLLAASAEERVRRAVEKYGDELVLSTSFGIQSAVLLHMVTQIKPDIPVIFVDTQYLFPETYQFAEALKERLNLNLHVYSAQESAAMQESKYGKRWEGAEAEQVAYKIQNKVEPMNRAVTDLGAKAWLTGLRREQNETRKDRDVTEQQGDITKVYPIIDWSAKDVYEYLKKHDLPYHPLWEQGYTIMGDTHSTTKEGRVGKFECGLHDLDQRPDNGKKGSAIDFQI